MRQKGYQTNAEYIESMMKQFKLVDMREQYRDLILEAESSAMDYESFLVRLLSVEEEGKRDRRTEKLRREACFEAEKRLEDIDYRFNQSLDVYSTCVAPLARVFRASLTEDENHLHGD